MEINKVIANSLNAADVKLNSQEQTEKEEVQETKSANIEETKDEDAALELDEDTQEKTDETDKKNKYDTKSTYMSELLKPDEVEDAFGKKDFIISEVNSAKSIGEIKNLLTNLEILDIDTQMEIMDIINSIDFDENLEIAKYRITSKLK